jgi:hypothetical protein
LKIDLTEEISKGLNVEQFNIATKLDEDELKKIGETITSDFESDIASRSDWLAKHTHWKQLYNQQDLPLNRPWDNSSDEGIPIMTEACNSFQARAYKAFFPTRKFLDCIPIGRTDEQTEKRCEKIAQHMSFQLGVINKNYKRDKNAMFLATALNGSDFTKTYYNPIIKQSVVERVRAVDLVVPYQVGPVQIDDVPRKTHIIRKTLNEIKILHQTKYFSEVCVKWEMDSEDEYQESENDFQGMRPSGSDSLEYGKILEQHCLLDLDGDGIKEPYIVWADAQSKKILRIQIRYEVDAQGQPLKDKRPIEYFEHYKFLENPDGFYGLGIGHLIGKLNSACNKMLRQAIDSAELANEASGFVDEKADIKGGELEMQKGKFIKISSFGDRIGDAFFQLQFPGPNAGMVTLMQGLESYARSLSSVTDAVTGDVEKVYQPVTITTMLEQSLQMPTSVMEQMAVSFQGELEKLYILNRKYLEQESYFVDNRQTTEINREDYAADLRVIPIFDPRNITKQQKIAKAQTLYQFALQNPIMAQDQKSLYEVSKKMLEAMDIEDIQDILPEPSAPPEPEKIDDQAQENMFFLMPAKDRPLFDVFPDQDHVTHIRLIDELLNGPFAEELSKDEYKDTLPIILEHRKKHIAFLYMNNQVRTQQYGQRSTGAMATQSNYEPSDADIIAALQAQGAGDGMQGGGAEAYSGAMGSTGPLTPNRYGNETGFLDQVLPLPQSE